MLDPRDDRSEARGSVALWLSLHEVFAYHPQDATGSFAQGASPEALLRAAGKERLCGGALAAALRKLNAVGARLLPRTDPGYPVRLARLSDAPPLLFVRGEPCFDMPTVAVVGARAATTAGRRFARQLASELAAAGVCVASGLARGIDAEAHRGALDAGGKSVAFLGCGIDRVYPPEHARLAATLARAGAVLSEFPLGVPPRAPHFPLRNRLISACADAVVVVEARERSGTLVTARHALDQGVDVWAAPGPLYAPSHTGSNGLLRDGAAPLVAAEDLLASLSIAPQPLEPEAGSAPADPILRALRDAPSTRDELARALGAAPEGLAARLLELELAGWVREDANGRLHVSR